jgi:hypothetical protein
MIDLAAALLATIAFVPLDDRPVTFQQPIMLARIAGVTVEAPPRNVLGRFLDPGHPDAIATWIARTAERPDVNALVVSADMLAYGGLIASRIPSPSYDTVSDRLAKLTEARSANPRIWTAVFGTIMRAAPTEAGADTAFFAAYPTWLYLKEYASLHDPPLPSEAARAKELRKLIGPATLNAYLTTRGRDVAVDRLLLQMTQQGTIDQLVLGHDDAGPVGIHVKDLRLLQAELVTGPLARHASIEPGADELGMVLVAHALDRIAGWVPRVAVHYSTPNGAAFQDPLEYAPISTAIDGLVAACGGKRVAERPDVALYVRLPATTAEQDDALLAAIGVDFASGHSVALADLSFFHSYHKEALFARRILASGLASRLDSYASWNTNANTTGTALAEAVAAGAGRRLHSYNALAHRTFTFVRFLSDYAFNDEVRPNLIATETASNNWPDSPLPPSLLRTSTEETDSELRSYGARILAQLYPEDRIAYISSTLPWGRVFDAAIDVELAPRPAREKKPFDEEKPGVIRYVRLSKQ